MDIDIKIKNLQLQIADLENKKEFLTKRNIDVESVLSHIKKKIGKKLKHKRTQKKISKTTLSDLSGVSRMTIHRAEMGESLLGIDSIVKICIALKCEFCEIVEIILNENS